MNQRIAARYALALMEMAEEQKLLEKLAEDLRDVEATISGSRELRIFLASPVASPEQKLKILNEIFGKRSMDITMRFMSLLVQKGRAEYVYAAAEEFLRMLDTKRNILRAKIQSAAALTEEEQMQLLAQLERRTGKRVRANFEINPALRGGFVARLGDDMVDASLKHQLENLREQFLQGGAPILN